MKTRRIPFFVGAVELFLFLVCFVNGGLAQIPQTMSYQGVLTDADGNAVRDGDYLIVFRLYDAAEGGRALWEEKQTIPVMNGLFDVILGKVIPLKLPFDQMYWLSIELSEDGTILEPRIELTSSAYSLNARAVADSIVTGRKIAAAEVVRSLNGLTDEVILAEGDNVDIQFEGQKLVISAGGANGTAGSWRVDGNADLDTSNFIGTLDTTAFTVRVNNQRAFKIRYSLDPEFDVGFVPSIIGGAPGNAITGSETGGSFIGGGGSRFDGLSNKIEGGWGSIVGGRANYATGFGFVGGGNGNRAESTFGAVMGGQFNRASGRLSAVGGGESNRAQGELSTIPGGELNRARGDHSFAAGLRAHANHMGSFVWSDATATAAADSFFSTGKNQFLIEAEGGVGIGTNQPTSPLTVAGVVESTAGGFKFPDGTMQSSAAASASDFWRLNGNADAQGAFIGTTDDNPFNIRVNNRQAFSIQYVNSLEAPNIVAGLNSNFAAAGVWGATICGGGRNGASNKVNANYGTIGGGTINEVDGSYGTVAGGSGNYANGQYSTVTGGTVNRAFGRYSAILGGHRNYARAELSFCLGQYTRANHEGSFLFADATTSFSDTLFSTGANQFLIRAAGGVGIGINTPQAQLHVTEAVNGSAIPTGHVAIIENNASSTSNGPDVLALKTSAVNPGGNTNFITFFDGNDQGVGRIEGNGAGGVEYLTTGADYAEALPRLKPGEHIEKGDIVGVYGGKITRRTAGAEYLMVVSSCPAVLGNMPPENLESLYEKVAFMGQVEINVRGPVRSGDFIVPSGHNDGTGMALAVVDIHPEHMAQIVGRAWESSDKQEVKLVNGLVGLPAREAVAQIQLQQRRHLQSGMVKYQGGVMRDLSGPRFAEAHEPVWQKPAKNDSLIANLLDEIYMQNQRIEALQSAISQLQQTVELLSVRTRTKSED